ncbi:MAG TPA: HAMP domain-containing protein, partial [Actinomycetota bacterium]|nr:HAMP domain-containing protein [Actinomycetota bacterium]
MLPSVSVRLKLTLLYGAVFLLAGAGLLAVNYALVRSQLNLPFKTRIEGPESARRQLPDVLRQGPLGVVVRVTPDGEQLVASADTPAAIEAARSELATIRRKLETAALNQLLAQSGVALALMAVVSIGLGWLVAGRVLRPLSAITATARRLEGSTLHERINLQGPQDELKELADTFDQMLGRLDAAFETQR